MGITSPSNSELLVNSIAFYVPSFVFFCGRLATNTFVLHHFHIDDYLMCLFFISYTALLVLINVSARFETNLFPATSLDTILSDPSNVHNRIIGSIIVIPLEQCMLLTTWGVKACLLFFLHRMTRQMPKTRAVLYALCGYVAIGYGVIIICYYAILCRPFSQYWALPVKNPQCATYSTYSKIQMVFNISSDIFIILMPTSIIGRSKLPMKRKAILMVVFSLGVFTIICAILNKFYNFRSPETTVYQLWYIREASVAMWVGNIVCCWQLMQHMFKLRSFDDKHANIKDEAEDLPRDAAGQTKNSAWFRERIFGRGRHTELAVSNGGTEVFRSQGSLGGTTLQDEKKMDFKIRPGSVDGSFYYYEDSEKSWNRLTVMSLTDRDGQSDASPAIKYRRENDIA